MNFTTQEIEQILNFIKASLEGASIPGREFSHAVEKFFSHEFQNYSSLKEKLQNDDGRDRHDLFSSPRLLSIINCKSDAQR
jgi:hypothetical protein